MHSRSHRAYRSRPMYLAAAVLAVTHLLASRATAADNPPPAPHVRARDQDMATLIDEGERRSAVLHALVERLNRSDVFVFVERRQLHGNLAGQVALVGASGPWRYLCVELDSRRMLLEQIATLGHELQHAVEIADAPSVVNSTFVQRLYKTIGFALDEDHQRYETNEARDTGRRVFRQLLTPTPDAAAPLRVRTSD